MSAVWPRARELVCSPATPSRRATSSIAASHTRIYRTHCTAARLAPSFILSLCARECLRALFSPLLSRARICVYMYTAYVSVYVRAANSVEVHSIASPLGALLQPPKLGRPSFAGSEFFFCRYLLYVARFSHSRFKRSRLHSHPSKHTRLFHYVFIIHRAFRVYTCTSFNTASPFSFLSFSSSVHLLILLSRAPPFIFAARRPNTTKPREARDRAKYDGR